MIDVPVSNGSVWYRRRSRRGVLTWRNRRYRGRLSAIIWYGVYEGPDRSNSLLLRNLRLAYICRRRLTCLLAMDRRGTVAVVEEASAQGKTGGIEVDYPPSYGMVCRKAPIVQTACCCVICDWHTYVDDDCRACRQWIGVVPSL